MGVDAAHAYADGGGADGVEGHVVPGERDDRLALLLVQDAGVHGGVEYGRVQAEPARLTCRVLGERHFREHRVVAPPGGAQALEDRPVAVSPVAELLVGVLDRYRVGAGRGPLGQGLARARRGVGEEAVRVGRPRRVLRALGTGVDSHGAASVALRPRDDAELEAGVLGQHQRRGEGQLLESGGAGRVPGREGQFHQARTGQQDPSEHHVVGEPRLRLHRQQARQHHATRVRQ